MTMADSIFAQACARAAEGMEIAAVAAAQPGRIALWSKAGSMTFGELNRQSNQLVRRLREAGVGDGDAVALTCGNRMEFAIVTFAAYRAGLRLTCRASHSATLCPRHRRRSTPVRPLATTAAQGCHR